MPPSVFAALPALLERTGGAARGLITAVYTVLVEGGDLDEPVADEVRALLDGHVVLDRALLARGRVPPVDVLASASRVTGAVTAETQRAHIAKVRALLHALETRRELIALGAYTRGSDALTDEALAKRDALERFLTQDRAALARHEQALLDRALDGLDQGEGLKLYGPRHGRSSLVSFTVEGAHAYDIGVLLDQQGIAVRTGHHCCQPLMRYYGIEGTCRASFLPYNTLAEVDQFLHALNRALSVLRA
jgi:hypothetical protein